jgi:hypothetical protein
MLAILAIVVPVFGLILIGWLAETSGYLGEGSGRVLAQFAFKVAMPAFLFKAMLSAKTPDGSPLALLAAYFGGTLAVWVVASWISRLALGRPRDDTAAVAMGATFGNTVMLGIPLALTAFGPEAAAPMALIIAFETPGLWVLATLQMEWALRREGAGGAASVWQMLGDLALNPIILAMVLGLTWRWSSLELPGVAARLLDLLSQAAVPTALFALGQTLATYRIRGEVATLSVIAVCKLVLYPVVVYLLATHVFELPPLWLGIAVLLAAMPVGANAFLFAARYDRVVPAISGALAVSTAIAVLSVSAVLYLLGAGGR